MRALPPTRCAGHRHGRGFTLVELLVVVAIVAVIVMVAGPSLNGLVQIQRLRGINAQMVTDIQLARTEALARQQPVVIRMRNMGRSVGTCYTIYTCNIDPTQPTCPCVCDNGPGTACRADRSSPSRWQEIRTVQVPKSSGNSVFPTGYAPEIWPFDAELRFDPVSNSISYRIQTPGTFNPGVAWTGDVDTRLDSDQRTMRVKVGVTGRPSVCSPADKFVTGNANC